MSGEARSRKADIQRSTSETNIQLSLDLDGDGSYTGATGIGFFDHMLTLFARHGRVSLSIECVGDLDVDGHHTVEDVAICLGTCLVDALGDKRGIARYGTAYVPMDECLARSVVDLSGRAAFECDAALAVQKVGDFDGELAWEFFAALSRVGAFNLHLDLLRGGNAHHAIEACFKAVARSLAVAMIVEDASAGVPSTKGVL